MGPEIDFYEGGATHKTNRTPRTDNSGRFDKTEYLDD
jgi:hypothetical protein